MAANGFRDFAAEIAALNARLAAMKNSEALPSNGPTVPPLERPPDTAKSSTSTQDTPAFNGERMLNLT